jgi:hypothetical protein
MAVGNIESFNISNKLPDYARRLTESLVQIIQMASQQGDVICVNSHHVCSVS